MGSVEGRGGIVAILGVDCDEWAGLLRIGIEETLRRAKGEGVAGQVVEFFQHRAAAVNEDAMCAVAREEQDALTVLDEFGAGQAGIGGIKGGG